MGAGRLETEIDRLYGLPLDEFTAERDALARRLRSEGRRDDAGAVAELRKPVLSAWVVNRLARNRPDEMRALVDAAAAMRAGKPEDERFRAAADDLVRAGRELLAAEGRRPTDAVVREVATTLRAAAAAEPELLLAGRATEPVEATGFEAMAGASPRGRRPAARREKKAAPDRGRVQAARKALTAAREEARRAGREADAAEREARRLRADAEAADRAVDEAEAALSRLSG